MLARQLCTDTYSYSKHGKTLQCMYGYVTVFWDSSFGLFHSNCRPIIMIPDTAVNFSFACCAHACVCMVVHVSLMSRICMLLHVLLSEYCMQRCNIPMDWRCIHEILQVHVNENKKGHIA